MGVRVIEEAHFGHGVLYCSTSMWAFGPLFDSADDAYAFLKWLPCDARRYSDGNLEAKFNEWMRLREEAS